MSEFRGGLILHRVFSVKSAHRGNVVVKQHQYDVRGGSH